MDFLLESQAQQDPKGFKQVLMCEWLGKRWAKLPRVTTDQAAGSGDCLVSTKDRPSLKI